LGYFSASPPIAPPKSPPEIAPITPPSNPPMIAPVAPPLALGELKIEIAAFCHNGRSSGIFSGLTVAAVCSVTGGASSTGACLNRCSLGHKKSSGGAAIWLNGSNARSSLGR